MGQCTPARKSIRLNTDLAKKPKAGLEYVVLHEMVHLLEPGMVLSVEPGIYVPGLSGFQHSDTVLITPTEMEKLTNYPRDLRSLTIKG